MLESVSLEQISEEGVQISCLGGLGGTLIWQVLEKLQMRFSCYFRKELLLLGSPQGLPAAGTSSTPSLSALALWAPSGAPYWQSQSKTVWAKSQPQPGQDREGWIWSGQGTPQ